MVRVWGKRFNSGEWYTGMLDILKVEAPEAALKFRSYHILDMAIQNPLNSLMLLFSSSPEEEKNTQPPIMEAGTTLNSNNLSKLTPTINMQIEAGRKDGKKQKV